MAYSNGCDFKCNIGELGGPFPRPIQMGGMLVALLVNGVHKTEHECGLPMAHYRYTHGKTHRYENLQV